MALGSAALAHLQGAVGGAPAHASSGAVIERWDLELMLVSEDGAVANPESKERVNHPSPAILWPRVGVTSMVW